MRDDVGHRDLTHLKPNYFEMGGEGGNFQYEVGMDKRFRRLVVINMLILL